MTDIKQPTKAAAHPLDTQINNLESQIAQAKAELEALESDKTNADRAHAFLVGQNPNTPIGPRCQKILERIEALCKNKSNIIVNLEHMVAGAKSQMQFESYSSIIEHLAKRYEI